MKQRKRIHYSEAQKAEMWDRGQKGDSMHAIARAFDRYHSSVSNILTQNGGIRPAVRKRAPISLMLIERETISRG
jgi:transposase-like protein